MGRVKSKDYEAKLNMKNQSYKPGLGLNPDAIDLWPTALPVRPRRCFSTSGSSTSSSTSSSNSSSGSSNGRRSSSTSSSSDDD